MAHLSMMDGERYAQAIWPLRTGINVYIPQHDRMGRISWTRQGAGIQTDLLTGLRAEVAVLFLDAAGREINGEDSGPRIYHLADAREKLVRVDAIIREEPW